MTLTAADGQALTEAALIDKAAAPPRFIAWKATEFDATFPRLTRP